MLKGQGRPCPFGTIELEQGDLMLGLVGAPSRKQHGHSRSRAGRPSRAFVCWTNMIQRCTNPKHSSFASYGGRGIKVCQRWLDSFDNFLLDMGEPPPGLTIDREKVDGDYEPGNCSWATRKEQGNNRRTNRSIELDGVTMNLKQWAESAGMSDKALRYRLKAGWSLREALTRPLNHANGRLRGAS